jgi:hypothetical protein
MNMFLLSAYISNVLLLGRKLFYILHNSSVGFVYELSNNVHDSMKLRTEWIHVQPHLNHKDIILFKCNMTRRKTWRKRFNIFRHMKNWNLLIISFSSGGLQSIYILKEHYIEVTFIEKRFTYIGIKLFLNYVYRVIRYSKTKTLICKFLFAV